jgi:hypothetical protein
MPKAISARSRLAARLLPSIDHSSCITTSASAAALRSGPPMRARRMPASMSAITMPPSARCGGAFPARRWV